MENSSLKLKVYEKKFQATANNFYCKRFKTKLVMCQHILPTRYVHIIVHNKKELNPLFRYNNKILIDS